MKKKLISVIIIMFINITLIWSNTINLEKVYKSKVVSLKLIQKIDNDSLPDSNRLVSPISLTEDKDRNIYISDYRTNNIKKFDLNGKFIKIIGRKGEGPGDLSGPTLINYINNKIIVFDSKNSRFCFFNTNGTFISSVKQKFGLYPKKIRIFQDKNILIEYKKFFFNENDTQDSIIKIFSDSLEKEQTLYKQQVLLGSMKDQSIVHPFPYLVFWDVSVKNEIIIGYSEKYMFNIINKNNKKLSSFKHTYKPVKINETDKENFFKTIVFYKGGRRIKTPETVKNKIKFKKYKPPFKSILADIQGNILVFLEKNENHESNYFDVFNPKGEFISNVQLIFENKEFNNTFKPDKLIPGKNGSYWLLGKDEDDEPIFRKFKISE